MTYHLLRVCMPQKTDTRISEQRYMAKREQKSSPDVYKSQVSLSAQQRPSLCHSNNQTFLYISKNHDQDINEQKENLNCRDSNPESSPTGHELTSRIPIQLGDRLPIPERADQ
jgi:hypothetical protein